MSLFDTLLGNTSNANTNNTSANNQTQVEQKQTDQSAVGNTSTSGTQTTTSGQTQKQTQNTNTTASGVTSSLDPATIAAVSGFLSTLTSPGAGGGADSAIAGIVQKLLTSADTPAVSAEDIAGQQSAARTSFNQGEAVNIGQVQQQIGSKGNTYSALLGQKGQQDLSSTLAGIVANAGIANNSAKQTALMNALQAISTGVGVGTSNAAAIANIVSALKGAQTTTNSAEGTSSIGDTVTQILESLQNNQNVNTNQNVSTTENTGATASGTSSSNTAGKQGSGLLGMLF